MWWADQKWQIGFQETNEMDVKDHIVQANGGPLGLNMFKQFNVSEAKNSEQ